MENLIPVNILIADRNYRLRIKPEDEEKLRKTVKLINEKIIEFKTNFAGKDMQDYIAMVLIWLATEETPPIAMNLDPEEITGKLKNLQKIIEEALHS
ncbi:MAG TPA: cell division protein ZapA [Parafilimonas sp.]|nr:cell division protein ZapA [Parafilimonas sp.]